MVLTPTPTGRYAWAGAGVPFDLAYRNEDGSPASDAQAAVALHCGPGFARPKLRAVSYASEGEAIADAKARGFEVPA